MIRQTNQNETIEGIKNIILGKTSLIFQNILEKATITDSIFQQIPC